jgi:hypothetical protein
MSRDLTISALFVALLLSAAAIGVRAREAHPAVAGGPALSAQGVTESLSPASSQASSPPSVPQAREPEVRGISPASGPGTTSATDTLGEAALMRQLREMRQSDPELSLRLAREGNERFPGSPDAAERASIVVKSLMRMGRADEATAEARAMVERYPGTSWALDVKRHMLDIPSYVPDAAGP